MLAVDKTEREERKKAVIDQLGPGGRSMMRREKVPNWERRNFLSSVRNNKPTTTTTTSTSYGLPGPQPAVSTAVPPPGLPVSPLIDLVFPIIIFPQRW